ncbi:putative membrane protein [Leptospira broomii serovar Hurstbridge str. 5399]|uniref:Membrane protein n=1 Tax=Leptospira broomii serovar Hurstbridge str. 5399 TaxID=1049789 RepID=T0GFT6_9LEPT|nr:putative membrane protein [Leptospira broomii serovar Hurstbridge str. 5399]
MPFFQSNYFRKTLLVFLLLAPLLYPFLLKPSQQLYSDHLAKFILGESIYRSGFTSGSLDLPSAKLDPESEFCPTECIRIREKIVSPFPVALGYFYAAILPWGGIEAVYIITALIVAVTLLMLSILWEWDLLFLFILVLGSPFVINGYFFPDVAIASFLFFSGAFFILKNSFRRFPYSYFLVGFISASAAWFRVESIVFIISFSLFLLLGLRQNKQTRIPAVFYVIGAACGLLLLLFVQMHMYGLPLGPRFSFNQPTMFLRPWDKLYIYRGLLFFSYGRPGFFTYMPLFLFFFVYSLYFIFSSKGVLRKQSPENFDFSRNLLIQSGAAAFLGSVLVAPNDGIIDFGTRYLHLAIPSFVGFAILVLKESSGYRQKLIKSFVIVLALYSTFVTVSYTQILAKYGKQSTGMHKLYVEQKPDLVVVQIRTYTQIMGKNFFVTPCVTLFDAAALNKFFSKNDPNQFAKILFVQAKVLTDRNADPNRPFEHNTYYDSVNSILGKTFTPVLVENKPDIIVFSMEKR